jgi:hypothetical protein
MKSCKACIEISHSDEIQKALKDMSEMKNITICKPDLYKSRLEICEACPSKTVSGVCMNCGCYAQIRAFVKNNKCPKKRW